MDPVRLYLDDARETPEGWERVYTAGECIVRLGRGDVDMLSLDHDLGPELSGVGTGYDVVCWLELRAHAGLPLPRIITIHSANPVGRERMTAGLTRIRQIQETRA